MQKKPWKFQYSLSSLLWFILCSALLLSGILMYRRMEKAERENQLLRHSAGYSIESEPVLVQYNWPDVNVSVLCNVKSILEGRNYIHIDYTTEFTFQNTGYKELKIHLPLIRASFCTPASMDLSNNLNPPWKQNKEIVLQKGESFTIAFPEEHIEFPNRDFFGGKDNIDYGRWALVFGMPEGENPDDYLVGTVLTNPIHWQIEKGCKIYSNP
jgi:hypothetical protein